MRTGKRPGKEICIQMQGTPAEEESSCQEQLRKFHKAELHNPRMDKLLQHWGNEKFHERIWEMA